MQGAVLFINHGAFAPCGNMPHHSGFVAALRLIDETPVIRPMSRRAIGEDADYCLLKVDVEEVVAEFSVVELRALHFSRSVLHQFPIGELTITSVAFTFYLHHVPRFDFVRNSSVTWGGRPRRSIASAVARSTSSVGVDHSSIFFPRNMTSKTLSSFRFTGGPATDTDFAKGRRRYHRTSAPRWGRGRGRRPRACPGGR